VDVDADADVSSDRSPVQAHDSDYVSVYDYDHVHVHDYVHATARVYEGGDLGSTQVATGCCR
jgi:hypothetical protein